jgi:hypothetical protein
VTALIGWFGMLIGFAGAGLIAVASGEGCALG